MSQEGQLLDQKALRAVAGKTANWTKLPRIALPLPTQRVLGRGEVRFESNNRWQRYWAAA